MWKENLLQQRNFFLMVPQPCHLYSSLFLHQNGHSNYIDKCTVRFLIQKLFSIFSTLNTKWTSWIQSIIRCISVTTGFSKRQWNIRLLKLLLTLPTGKKLSFHHKGVQLKTRKPSPGRLQIYFLIDFPEILSFLL